MLEAIGQPKWRSATEHRERVFTDILYDWENLIATYVLQSGETVSDALSSARRPLAMDQRTPSATFVQEQQKHYATSGRCGQASGSSRLAYEDQAHTYLPRPRRRTGQRPWM